MGGAIRSCMPAKDVQSRARTQRRRLLLGASLQVQQLFNVPRLTDLSIRQLAELLAYAADIAKEVIQPGDLR